MKKAMLTIAAATTLVVGTLAAASTADAQHRHRHHHRGGHVGAGIAAGIIGGAIIGGAIVNSGPRYYGPEPGYVMYDGYRGRYPSDCYGGYWARRPVRDGYGNVIGWSKPRFVCP